MIGFARNHRSVCLGIRTDTDGEKEKSWWERLNTPSEGNDARSMFPLYDVEMRDWEGITPYEDPDYVAQNLGNARNDDPHWRASTGNLNEVMQDAKYSGGRDLAIGAGIYGIGKGLGGLADDVPYDARGAGSARWGSRKLPFNDPDRLKGVNDTLDRMDSGGPFPYAKDGSVFGNKEGRLPSGNYREYTVETPGASNRGTRRIVQDTNTGRTYYTDDHYETFVQIDPRRR